ncbi:MAG: HPF/RaiA family ribosome-associated protein [Baekduia sp.]
MNGPRGGIDKECRILASIPHRSPVIVADQAGGFYEAIDLASHKLKRAISKVIDRRSAAEPAEGRRAPPSPG